ncbi:MAG: lipoprotein [Capnocytophaga sp.]|nr:lipoprotein [Capnocytophaga sp.]
MKKMLLFFGLLAGVSSCSTEDNRTYADNPTDRTLTFSIDGKAYSIPPKEHLRIDLSAGEHTLTLESGENVSFTKADNDKSGLLNPANAHYITWTVPYTGTPVEQNRAYLNLFKDLEIDGVVYHGPFKVIEGFYNGNPRGFTWNFGLDEDFSDTYEVNHSSATSYNLMLKKLYRLEDFITAYNELEEE